MQIVNLSYIFNLTFDINFVCSHLINIDNIDLIAQYRNKYNFMAAISIYSKSLNYWDFLKILFNYLHDIYFVLKFNYMFKRRNQYCFSKFTDNCTDASNTFSPTCNGCRLQFTNGSATGWNQHRYVSR